MSRFLIIIVALLVSVPASARAESQLLLSEVLSSLRVTHPKLAEVSSKIEERRGLVRSERGAFDPLVSAKLSMRPTGYYEHAWAQVGLSQRIPGTGLRVEGKHRWAGGDVPDYYGERATGDAGELSMRVVVPVLADRATDAERTAIRTARIDADLLRTQANQTWLELSLLATVNYYEWVGASQLLRVARQLMEIAELRVGAIAEQVERGSTAGIELVDAERVLLARKSKLLAARSKFVDAQQKLSLYYRNRSLEPILVDEGRAPAAMPDLGVPVGGQLNALIETALSRRPELRALKQELARARAELGLANNQRSPSLDLELYAARDLGAIDPSQAGTDTGVSLSFKLPVGRRKATGKAQALRAKMAAIEARERGLRDRIVAELRGAVARSELARERAELAQQRWKATEELAAAERAKLVEGASNLLTVNLRERDVASSASDAIESALAMNRAIAELYLSSGLSPWDARVDGVSR